jgi:Nif-specific regulatory protein
MRARLTLEAGDCLPSTLDLFPGQPVTLGRSRDNTFVVRDEVASRLHAKLYFEDGHWHVRDFGLNGTWLDSQKLNGSCELADGSKIRIGETVLRFNTQFQPGQRPATPAITPPPPMKTVAGTYHGQTKIHELPPARAAVGVPTPSPDATAQQLRVDELTALCKFMTHAVETPDPHALISLALRAILHQTAAKLAGYMSLDPDDPTPKLVMPDSAPVDVPLSRRLTQKAQKTGKLVWLIGGEDGDRNPSDSLSSFADALCIPLRTPTGAFASLHVYRTGRAFSEPDVRFIEAVSGHLSRGLEIHRTRRTLEAENSRLRTHLPAADEILGGSSAVMHLRGQILRAAPQPFTVLVTGESGSGKELVALALHRNSKRADGPLVVVNCAAIAPTLLEAELFGYRKGAFSGADRDHPGMFQQADEGTLFLDEVGEMSLECQAKLLRVIEGKAFRPVGGTADLKADVRVVAATHRDLEKEVAAGRFRQDLFFRLKVIQLRVPSLREHPEDVPELAEFFLAKVSSECRRHFRLTAAALRKLQSYTWPGNVRQLRAVLESAAVMSESDTLDAESFPVGGVSEPGPDGPGGDIPPSLDMDAIETWAIRRALRQTGGNVSHAAKLLGVSRDTLHTKLKKKGIDRESLVATPEPVGVGS